MQVHAALAYYFDNREAIWQCIREDEAYAASVKQQLTGGPVVITGLNVDAIDTPVSPDFLQTKSATRQTAG